MPILHRVLCAIGIKGHEWVSPKLPEWPKSPGRLDDPNALANWMKWEMEMSMHRAESVAFIGTPDSCGVCGVERRPWWWRFR